MKLTETQISKIKALYLDGSIEILKGISMKQIEELRAGRVRKENNEETLWSLAESVGGEKSLFHFFTRLDDLTNPERH